MDTVVFAHENGLKATKALSRHEQKQLGQFMTPPAIARAMAKRACARLSSKSKLRILEPAAGTGILAAAALQELLCQYERPKQIFIQLFEVDVRLESLLLSLAQRMRRDGRRAGVRVSVSIRIGDFLLSEMAEERAQFDLVISNPPYFKLNKSDERSVRHSYAVYGQPNIYALFMAASARILNAGGRWCFITPRSWTNGTYFAAARRQILMYLHLEAMHLFKSRQEHFTEDEVLQEAMITWATAQASNTGTITVSTSAGIHDLEQSTLEALPTGDVINAENQNTISLPSPNEFASEEFSGTLAAYGLKVSTGPVVAFRAADFLSERSKPSTVPLLWMQHIQHMKICWPIQKKREHISANAATAWMLVPNENMVVLRRFSPKEDIRRITAAPLISGTIPGGVIGLENHANYIYRPGGQMSPDEAKGLAAFLNSSHADAHLRRISGSTQVNAADLRGLPLPSLSELVRIGQSLPTFSTLRQADFAVDRVLGRIQQAVVA